MIIRAPECTIFERLSKIAFACMNQNSSRPGRDASALDFTLVTTPATSLASKRMIGFARMLDHPQKRRVKIGGD